MKTQRTSCADCVCVVAHSCPTLCDLIDCSPPGSPIHGIIQATILWQVAIPFSRGSSYPTDRTWVSCTVGRFFTVWAIRKPSQSKLQSVQSKNWLTFWRVFIINGCWILSKAFSASIEIIIWLLSFILIMWCITLIDLQTLKNPCIPVIKPTWSWCMIFLICCWNLFDRILLRIFCIYVHPWYWPEVFFFCGIFVRFWY